MGTIQHESIADPYIHEPKGVAAATAREVYVADGAGSGAWQKLEIQSLEGVSGNGSNYDAVLSNGSGGFQVLAPTAYGAVYFFNTGTPYSWTYSASFTKVAATTSASGLTKEVTEGTDTKLTYTGTLSRYALVNAHLCVAQAAGGNRDLEVAIYKNGVLIPGSTVVITSVSGAYHEITVTGETTVATNDYFEIYMRNTGGSGNVNVAAIQFNMKATP